MTVKLFVLLVFLLAIAKSQGYYWRDYYGKVPADAIEAGTDINDESVYVGQAFVKPGFPGIYATGIQKGKDVIAPILGPKKADNFVQILCGQDPHNFSWEPTNATHLHLLKTDNVVIRGGLEDDQWLYVGRVRYQGSTLVGKVLAGHVGAAQMWFVYNGQERQTPSYEVLTYNDVASKISVRAHIR